MTLAALVFLAGGLSPVASGYQEFYRPVPGFSGASVATWRASEPPKTPQLVKVEGDFDTIYLQFRTKGFEIIGSSSFTSGWKEKEKGALKQGQKVGADIVAIRPPAYDTTVQTTRRETTPFSATTSWTSPADGGSSQTTRGSVTQNVPTSFDRLSYEAYFFVKTKPALLGAIARDLTNEEKAALESNSGAYIGGIVDDSPAFDADILAGDIITEVAGRRPNGRNGLYQLVEELQGQQVEIGLVRRGARISKTVTLRTR